MPRQIWMLDFFTLRGRWPNVNRLNSWSLKSTQLLLHKIAYISQNDSEHFWRTWSIISLPPRHFVFTTCLCIKPNSCLHMSFMSPGCMTTPVCPNGKHMTLRLSSCPLDPDSWTQREFAQSSGSHSHLCLTQMSFTSVPSILQIIQQAFSIYTALVQSEFWIKRGFSFRNTPVRV